MCPLSAWLLSSDCDLAHSDSCLACAAGGSAVAHAAYLWHAHGSSFSLSLHFLVSRCVSIGYTFLMKDVGLRIRVQKELREKFLVACRRQDKPASQVLREFMREYVQKSESSGADDSSPLVANEGAKEEERPRKHN